MKRLNIILSLALVGMAYLMSACSDEIEDRSPSYVPDPNAAQVYFAEDVQAIFEVLPVDNSITVTISREKTDGALTVNFQTVDLHGVFTIPQSVTFAAGESDVSFDITFTDLEVFKEYPGEIIVDEVHTNPYVEFAGTPNYAFVVQQSDWADWANGMYFAMFFGAEWEQVLQYSEILDRYRFPSLYAAGYHFDFGWDGGAEIQPGGSETASGYFRLPTGYVHPDHGMVRADTDADPAWTNYNADTQTFTFDRNFNVVAGSFGWMTDTYTITEYY